MDGAHVFDIEFRDICWDSVLQQATFDETFIQYDLWQMQVNVFT